MRGCAPALELLLDRELRFRVEPWRSRRGQQGEYDSAHEAAWAGARWLLDHDADVEPGPSAAARRCTWRPTRIRRRSSGFSPAGGRT